MGKYVAFLRAVNVGKRTVKMETLRQQLGDAGFKKVQTYIQSGNVMFESGSSNAAALAWKMEALLLKNYGFEVPVLIRSVTEMEAIVAQTPFPGIVPDKTLRVYVTLLSRDAGPEAAKIVASLQSEAKTLHIKGLTVYTLINSTLELKPPDVVMRLEKKLGVPCTTRNWATINKMIW